MRFRLLGPVEALAGEQPVPLGALKQRHLLAALLFDGGSPATFDTLIDRLWDDDPPADARGTLYGYVARLRRTLRAAAGEQVRLESWPGGYTLHAPVEAVDLYRFRALVEASRATEVEAERAALLAEALGLWRADALAGLPGEWAHRAREGLARHRQAALAAWAGAALAVGQHAAVIDRLTAALAHDPLAEPLIAAQLRALHAAGRTPEALELYARSRARIAADLGTEPGRMLRETHTLILRAPAPEVRPPDTPARLPRAVLPPDLPDFTGHAEEAAGVTAALTPGQGAPPPVVVVSGPGGAGKSALAVHVAHRLRDDYPDGRLFLNVGGADPLGPAEAVSRALRALGVTDADAQGNPDLRERVARYRAELAGRRILVVLDDVATARQVQPFLPTEPGSALLVTSRSRLTTLPSATRVEVGVLSAADASALLTRMIGADRAGADPAQTARLADLCGRLPLAVRVAGARLLARPHWTVAQLADRLGDERRRLDELAVDELEVRAGLAVSYRGLRPRAQEAFRALGSLDPPDLTALTVAALLGAGLDEAADLVEEITDARLLDVVAPGGWLTRYRMHDLVRLYAAELARAEPDETVVRVTRAVTAMIEVAERIAEPLPVAVPRMYRPEHLPAPGPEWTAALQRVELCRYFGAEEPAMVAAVERAAALDLDAAACALADALVFASFAKVNNFAGWERTHTAAARVAQRTGNRRAAAAIACGIAQLHYAHDRLAASRAAFTEAVTLFEATGDDHGLAVALNGLGTVGRELSEHHEAVPHIRRALAMLERQGDDAGVAHARYSLGFACRELGDDAAALTHFGEALSRYRACGHARGELVTIRAAGLVHRARGDLAAAGRHCADAHERALRVGDEHLIAYTTQALAKVWIRQGDPGSAAEPLAAAMTAMTAHRDGQGAALVARTIGEMHLAAGRYPAAVAELTRAAARWRAIGMALGHARTLRDLGAALMAGGDHAAAHERWAAAAETFGRSGVREKDELTAWRARWGCHCAPDQLTAAVSSAARNTRSTLPPASAASSSADQPRPVSSANNRGYPGASGRPGDASSQPTPPIPT